MSSPSSTLSETIAKNSDLNSRSGLKAIAIFIGLFLASWITAVILGVGITQIMNWLHAGPNLRTFIGDTIARGGNLVVQLILVSQATRLFLKRSLSRTAFLRSASWWKDLSFGLLIASLAMGLVFIFETAMG